VTALNRDTSVFVNCPFDDTYRRALQAVVYTCVAAGFYPVLGTHGSMATPRMERILEVLSACRYSIHDLSRCRGEGGQNLARFNMPLELGMAVALRGHAPHAHDAHDYLMLVPDEAYIYHQFVSDLSGLDPFMHDGTPDQVSVRVLAWLISLPNAPSGLSPQEVLPKLAEFERAWEEIDRTWHGTPPWGVIVERAVDVAVA
jgi:hypothetical protein